MNDKYIKTGSDEDIARKLNRVAEQTNVNTHFASELEEKLRKTRQRKPGWLATAFRQASPTLRWAALMALLVLILSWSIKTLIPTPQPASDNTPALPAIATPTLTATADGTVTPAVESEGYDWRGAKLHLAGPLPESPAEANVYLLKEEHMTVDEKIEIGRSLAQRFGIDGEMYQLPGDHSPGDLAASVDYMITDGKQRLYVRSKNYFTYYTDYNANVSLLGAKEISDEEAQTVIDAFLKSHGFDLKYQIEKDYRTPGIYYVIPLTPDGRAIRFDYNMASRLQVTIGNNGQIISVDSSQVEYETVGMYGIRSAEEAFQQVLGSAASIQTGVLESSHSGGVLNEQYWERSYPENQTVTIYGRVTVFNPVDPGKSAFVSIDNYTATGNTPPAHSDQMIEATGQFYLENGVRKFNVETWKASDAMSVMGTLQREGDQTVLVSDMGDRYVIPDAPADVPLNTVPPDEQLLVNGVLADGDLIWTSIQYFPAGSNYGGGGGGGTGFYKLNLSGTPVPFPSATAQPESTLGDIEYIVEDGDTVLAIAEAYGTTPEKIFEANSWLDGGVLTPGKTLIIPGVRSSGPTEYTVQDGDTLGSIALNFGVAVEELNQANNLTNDNIIYVGQKLVIPSQQAENPYVGRRFEKQRGNLMINVYKQADGSTQEEFLFITKNEDGFLYTLLEDVAFESLKAYHNQPLDIWGTVKYVDQNGTPVIAVEKYEAPYPELAFQLVQGTQKNVEIDGAPVTIFTADDGKSYVQMTRDGLLSSAIAGDIGDKIYAEALLIPDETYGGYPTMRIFNMGLAVNPKGDEPMNITITADQPYVMDEALAPENYVPPDATVEKVELVYYIADPRYVPPDANAGPQSIQPVWRFYGHYSNGDEFEILVQALKQEYLLPEIGTYTPPG